MKETSNRQCSCIKSEPVTLENASVEQLEQALEYKRTSEAEAILKEAKERINNLGFYFTGEFY